MGKQIHVVYEHGVFRPLEPVDLEEHQRYSIEIVRTVGGEPVLDEEFIESCTPKNGQDVSIAVNSGISWWRGTEVRRLMTGFSQIECSPPSRTS